MVSDQLQILIVDDDRRMARTLVDILRVKGYGAQEAHSGEEALQMMRTVAFDCVLTDIRMPEMNGVELYRLIKAEQPDLPVVLMTAYTTNNMVGEGIEEGAVTCLTKPLDINMLLNFLSSLRMERTIIIVDDDPRFSETLGDILRARHFKDFETDDPHELLDVLVPEGYHIVLLDMKLKNTNGLEVLKQIRKRNNWLPVILVTGFGDEMGSVVKEAMEFNAYTCLYKPLKHEELFQKLTDIHIQELRRILHAPVAM